jgi:pimeloyl-ACP methyl ester carboxylesterase
MKCFIPTIALVFLLGVVLALENCGGGGRGYCPTGNTCCPILSRRNEQQLARASDERTTYGCIPNDLGSHNATCCTDQRTTGCPVSYWCSGRDECIADDDVVHDPLVQRLPRYQLCPATDQLLHVHGFPIPAGGAIKDGTTISSSNASFVYYSSHGDLLNVNISTAAVDMVLFIVHGAGRNADDYFCSLTAADQRQKRHSNVLLIAPRFPVASDDRDLYPDNPLLWQDDQASGPWRYGANAVSPLTHTKVSSYECLDRMVRHVKTNIFPKRIVVAGHSSGGQFVQRWSLLTREWDNTGTVLMRGVVANPSSYAYLSPQRWIHGRWQIPSTNDNCSGYNRWEWGLDPGGDFVVPYVRSVLRTLGRENLLIKRFAQRELVYLAGSLDVCNVPGQNSSSGWCFSHGLETSCQDMMQGSNRWQRHHHYLASLDTLNVPYHRFTIPGVGHDHSLMFNSANGLRAIFHDIFSSSSAVNVSPS